MIFLHILFLVLKETKESSNKRRWVVEEKRARSAEKKNGRYVRNFLLFVIMFEMILFSHHVRFYRVYVFMAPGACSRAARVLVLPLYEQQILIKYSQMLFFS